MKQKKKTVFVLFIELLFLFGGCLVIFSSFWFPGNGGYTRNVLFIHSDEIADSQGYFIFVDELSGRAKTHDIDFVLHGRGSLSIAGKESVTFLTNSYTTAQPVSVKTTFLSPITSITQFEGGFYPDFRREDIYHTDNITNYIKARYSGESTSVMGSVIYPHNDSDVSHPIPSISAVSSTQFGKVGANDLIYYQSERNLTSIFDSTLEVITDASIVFIHQNATDGINYYYADDVKEFCYDGQLLFESSAPVTVLVNYQNFTNYMTGYVHLLEDYSYGSSPIDIKIRLPFEDTSPYSYIFDNEDSSVTVVNHFMEKETMESFSFYISSTPVNQNARIVESSAYVDSATNSIFHVFPDKSMWEISQTELDTAISPYILFNPTELANLKTKITTNQEPWENWYNAITSNVDEFVATDISEWDEDERDDKVQPLILKYIIEENQTCFEKVKEILLDMETVESMYEKDLRRSYALQSYSIAYDLIRENLTTNEKTIIDQLLTQHALPLINMEIFSDNNHRCIDAAGLGMVGLVTRNKEFVDIATQNVLKYIYEKPRADGGSYEGQSYLAFALQESIQFMQALTHVNGYNFFEDSKYLACLDFMAHSLSPLGTVPLFEDTYLTADAVEVLVMAAPHISNSSQFTNYPNYFQWLFEIRQNNSALVGLDTYYYLYGDSANLRRIALYDPDFKINATLPDFRSQMYTDTNMAFLREDYGPNSLYLALSSKNFMQSHPHYDENSFELWGYGAWLIHNPGYPNFGKAGHDYTISTEASNTLLIDGRGQQVPQARGLTLTIQSPYFDIVKADATQSYTSPGSWITAWAVNGLVFLTTALIGISGILLTRRNRSKMEKQEEIKTTPWKLFDVKGENQLNILISRDSTPWETRLSCAKENLVNFSVLAAANVCYFIFVILRFEFYMTYSDNPLKILIPIRGLIYTGLIFLPVVLLYIFNRGYVNAFNRNLHRFIDFPEDTKNSQGRTRKMISRSLFVHFPWIIIASIVIGFTIVKEFIAFESIFFETVGGVGETVYYLFGWLQKYVVILGILLLTQIPFTYISLRRLNSEIIQKTNTTTSARMVKLKTLSISILLKSLYILLYLGFFMIMIYLTSLIGIEML